MVTSTIVHPLYRSELCLNNKQSDFIFMSIDEDTRISTIVYTAIAIVAAVAFTIMFSGWGDGGNPGVMPGEILLSDHARMSSGFFIHTL